MNSVLYYNPGQQVSVVFETLNNTGSRAESSGDGYTAPTIERIIFPNLSLAAGYPKLMTRLDIGLYLAQFTLPTQATAVGTYIVDISYFDPGTGNPKQTFVQVVVSAPGGQYTISTF